MVITGICDKKKWRQNLRYANIPCSKTLRRVIGNLVQVVECKLARLLPEKFAIAFDGWSKNRIHFLAMFAIWTPPNGGKLGINLLTVSPLAGKGSIGPNDTIVNDIDVPTAVGIEATNFSCW